MNRLEFEIDGKKYWYDHDEFLARRKWMRRKEIELLPEWLVNFMYDFHTSEKDKSNKQCV